MWVLIVNLNFFKLQLYKYLLLQDKKTYMITQLDYPEIDNY